MQRRIYDSISRGTANALRILSQTLRIAMHMRRNVNNRVQEAINFVFRHLQRGLRPDEVASELLDYCLSSDPKQSCGVGCDNMTCVVVVLNAPHTGRESFTPSK